MLRNKYKRGFYILLWMVRYPNLMGVADDVAVFVYDYTFNQGAVWDELVQSLVRSLNEDEV